MEVSQEFFLKIAFKWETPFVGMLPKKASWDLCFAQETKGLPQKQDSRKALVQPDQPVLLNVDK